MTVPVVSNNCSEQDDKKNIIINNNNNSDKILHTIQNPTIVPFDKLKDGEFEFGDSGEEFTSLPSWFDIERARKGQKFARERLYGVFYSHLIALFFLLAQKDVRQILYYTRKSETRHKAMMRYLATMLQVKLWYQSDITDDLNCPFFKSLKNVRDMHKRMGNRVQKEQPDFTQPVVRDPEEDEGEIEEELEKNTSTACCPYSFRQNSKATLSKRNEKAKKLWQALKSDMETAHVKIPLKQASNHSTDMTVEGNCKTNEEIRPSDQCYYYFSQYDMTLTQWSFCLLLHYPEKFGVFNATDEEYENFLHLWAIIGHALGMKPEYNLCLGSSLSDFRMYSDRIFKDIFFPGFFQVNYESEVMWKALAEGTSKIVPFLSYDYILLQVVQDYLDTSPHQLMKTASLRSKFRRFFAKFVVFPLLKYSAWFRRRANFYVENSIKRAAREYYGIDDNDHMCVAKQALY